MSQKSLLVLLLNILFFSSAKASLLRLPKSHLEKPFILMSHVEKGNDTYEYSRSHIVDWKKIGKDLFLKSKDQIITYKFPIKKDENDYIEIDLSEGIDNLYFQSSVNKTELDNDHPQKKIYKLPSAIIKNIELNHVSFDRLVIQINLNVESHKWMRMEFNEDSLSSFSKKEHKYEELLGVYGTFPNPGNDKIYAVKQELPATFYYAPNFPASLLPSLEHAIEYWNKALGGKKIVLKKAPSKEISKTFSTNYIDYLHNRDNDGGARGVYAVHPDNGKIISSYIYVPSGFSYWGRVHFDDNYPDSPVANRGQLVEDYLTHTLAHEIGHTLGLRHNFAGSNESNIDKENYLKIFNHYLETLNVSSDIRPSSTVMDYIGIEYFALMGAKMRLSHQPLSYDQKAVRWLYNGELPDSFGSFCTHYGEPISVKDGGVQNCQAWDQVLKTAIKQKPASKHHRCTDH